MVKVIFQIQTLLTHSHRHVLYCLIISSISCHVLHPVTHQLFHQCIEGQMGLQELGHSRVMTFLASEPNGGRIPKSISHSAAQDLPIRPIKTCKTAWTVSKIHIQTTSKTSGWLLRTHPENHQALASVSTCRQVVNCPSRFPTLVAARPVLAH